MQIFELNVYFRAVIEFTKKLQNIPLTRRETMRQAYRQTGHQDSGGSIGEKARNLGYQYLPEVEVNGASPPRSPQCSLDTGGQPLLDAGGQGANARDARRPSSPQVSFYKIKPNSIFLGYTRASFN